MSYLDQGPPRLRIVGLRELAERRISERRLPTIAPATERPAATGRAQHHSCQAAILGLTGGGMVLLAIAPLNGPGFALAGFVLLLLAQPFWLVATWRARQWGMFVNAIVYTAATLAGLFTSFSALPSPTSAYQVGQRKLLAQMEKAAPALPALPNSLVHARTRARSHARARI